MTKNIEYLDCFKFHYNSLNKKKKIQIKKILLENKISPSKIRENGMPADNGMLTTEQFVLSCILENRKAILTIQEHEYTQDYKYSAYFIYEDNIDLEGIKDLDCITPINKVEFLNTLENIKGAGLYKLKDDIYFKFTFKEEVFSNIVMETFKTKLSFVVILDTKTKIVEIRYDSLGNPFKSRQNYYIEFITKILNFFEDKLNVKLSNLNMDFLHINLPEIRENCYNVLSKEAQYDDCGAATMISNEVDQLPYIDEIMDIFDSKESNYLTNPIKNEVFTELKEALHQFIKGKEEEARHKWIIMLIDDYRTKFTFYHTKNMCIIHHNSINVNQIRRLDYVKEKILELKTKFNI